VSAASPAASAAELGATSGAHTRSLPDHVPPSVHARPALPPTALWYAMHAWLHTSPLDAPEQVPVAAVLLGALSVAHSARSHRATPSMAPSPRWFSRSHGRTSPATRV